MLILIDVLIALQVETLETLRRLSEHFACAIFSIKQSREFDGVCLVVNGCMAAIADCIMRKRARDHTSEVLIVNLELSTC